MLDQSPAPEKSKERFLQLAQSEGALDKFVALPVYVLGVRTLARGAVAPGAKKAGWQFVTVNRENKFVSGDVWDRDGENKATVTRTQGFSVERLFQAYEKAKNFDQVRSSSYEPRALRIPELHIEAFWLRRVPDQPGVDQLDADFIVTFKTFDPSLSNQLILTTRQFINATQELARKRSNAEIPSD